MIGLDHVVIAAVICLTVLASLVQVLRHLSAMRGTTGEIAVAMKTMDERFAMLRADLDNEKAKLTQLSNRVR